MRSGERVSSSTLPIISEIKPVHIGLLILVVCVLVLAGFVLSSKGCAGGGDSNGSAQASDASGSSSASGEPVGPILDIAPSTMLKIPGSKSVQLLTIDGDSVTASDCSFDTSSIKSAVSAIEDYADCGFVFVDMNTGRGLVYNADEEIYIASAAKVVLTQYALLNGAGAEEWERSNIEEAIEYSDNDAYEGFAYNYSDDEGYGDWLSAHNAWFDNYVFDLYPPMSARSLASFWVETLHFLEGGSDTAKWFGGLLGSTDTSFIRDAVAGTGTTVKNKGGWIGEEGYASVTDAGIIELDGHTYLMVIETGQFDGGIAEDNVVNLASALFAVRDQLNS